MHYPRLYLVTVVYLPLQLYVNQHRQEQQVLIEIQLVLHVADLGEYLVDHQSESSQIFPDFCLFYFEGEVVVLFEDEGGLCLG